MDIDYIVKTFLETLKGVPITLIIMIVAMVLSFLPALFFGLGADLQGSRGEEFFSGLSGVYPSDSSDFIDSLLL